MKYPNILFFRDFEYKEIDLFFSKKEILTKNFPVFESYRD